jgi:D-sedoheptulose 7-phosphate isomerase
VTSSKIIDNYIDESISCLQNLKKMNSLIEKISKIIIDARDSKRKIFLLGNGGSASTASHFICDLNKTSTMKDKSRLRAISLVDNIPTISAYGNDLSYDSIFAEQLKNLLEPKDVVIAISGSGNSKNVIEAVSYAKEKGAIVVGLTGFDGGKLKSRSDECLVIPSNSMYRIEDMHLMINHIITSVLREGTDYK